MPEQSSTLDEAHLRSWIGREAVETDTISTDLANRFAATFDLERTFAFGDTVPPLFHFCLAQTIAPTRQIGEDGHLKRGSFLPPVPLPRRMWAAGSVHFSGDLHVGEAVKRISRIADVSIKSGRSGALCFVVVEHSLEARGRSLVTERQDIVYRGVDPAPKSGAPVSPAPVGANSRNVNADPVILFRYSALTFNGHRIHYDKPYAMGVEGYPGLVVHGPLQATLLINFATGIRGRPPARFAFRSQSPLFDDRPFTLNAEEVDGKLKLWTAAEAGPAAMTAEATWT